MDIEAEQGLENYREDSTKTNKVSDERKTNKVSDERSFHSIAI
jgi:hypothetical protein